MSQDQELFPITQQQQQDLDPAEIELDTLDTAQEKEKNLDTVLDKPEPESPQEELEDKKKIQVEPLEPFVAAESTQVVEKKILVESDEEDDEEEECPCPECQSKEKPAEKLFRRLFLSTFVSEKPFAVKRLSEKFPIYELSNFLEPSECEWIIEHAKTKTQRSTTVIDDQLVYSAGRTSQTAFLTKDGTLSTEEILKKVQLKAAALSWFPISYIEAINATYYQAKEFFGPHHDSFEDAKGQKGPAGDRLLTYFVYLNTVPEGKGGRTIFPDLDLKIQPEQGKCIFWPNTNGTQFFKETLHEGETLEEGEKWGLNIWIRENAFTGCSPQ